MTKIKLCGLTTPQDIQVVNRLRPEYIGFVCFPKSRRYLPPEQAAKLRELLAPGIQAVGVFVDAPPRQVAELLETGVIDLAQLHGQEDEEYLRQLRRLTSRPIIQAVQLRSPEDVTRGLESSADYLLFDTGAGTGKVFDWEMTAKVTRPYFLAGGLSPENVAQAIHRLSPFGVDVSSGIEHQGKKSPERMEAFVSAVREISL